MKKLNDIAKVLDKRGVQKLDVEASSDESDSEDILSGSERPERASREYKEGETESDQSLDFENDSDFENVSLPDQGVEIDLERFRKKAGLGSMEIREALLRKEEPVKVEDEKQLQASEKKDKKPKKKVIAVWTHEEDTILMEAHGQQGNQWKEIQKLFPDKSKE